MNACEAVIVFARFPEPGACKTRLIPRLGAEGAARLYRRLAERTFESVLALDRPRLLRVVAATPPDELPKVRTWVGSEFTVRAQAKGDLGDRMQRAVADAFDEGARRVLVVGTDCPALGAEELDEALDALEDHDAVVGPALDGGYVLIGFSRPLPHAFEDVPWSSPDTLRVTRERLAECGARVAELEPRLDLDTPEDLDAWDEEF